MTDHVKDAYSQIDWKSWQPSEEATLGFVISNEHILLIRKQRGLGAGKITGPGGRLDPGETPERCVIRELQEELHLEVANPSKVGELWFQFTDGYALKVFIFSMTDYQGEPQATDEAIPLWFHFDKVPFDEMWEDDILWFPLMRRGDYFVGRFLFEKDKLVDGEISTS